MDALIQPTDYCNDISIQESVNHVTRFSISLTIKHKKNNQRGEGESYTSVTRLPWINNELA